MSWSVDVVLEFLELYRREQVLWDPKHPNHRNRTEVNDAWLNIQSSLSINSTIVDLKKKKESLMTSFRMHWNKKRKSTDGYNPTWFAYPLMESFLGGKYECDSTNQLEQEFFNNSSSANYSNQNQTDQNFTRNSLNDRSSTVRQNKTVSYPQATSGAHKTSCNSDGYTKRQVDDAVTYLKSTAGEKREKDEYELYGELLAKKLRKLDEHQRDVAMHEIDNIMFRAKMQSTGTTQNRSYPSSPSPVPRKVKSPIFIVTQQPHTQYEDENITYQEHLQTQQPSS